MANIRIEPKDVIVTTADLHENYQIIGPVYFQLNNAGNSFSSHRAKYAKMLDSLQKSGLGSNDQSSGLELFTVLFLDAREGGVGHSQFDEAFFIAVEELKIRAALLKADAIIGMRHDLDLDTNGWQHFYLQIYGTAVRTEKLLQTIENEKYEEEKRKQEEFEQKQIIKEKREQELKAISNNQSGNNVLEFLEHYKQYETATVYDFNDSWNSLNKDSLSQEALDKISKEINVSLNLTRMYGKSSVKINGLIDQIEEIVIADSLNK